MMWPRTPRDTTVAVAVVLATVLTIALYVDYQRPRADYISASAAISGIDVALAEQAADRPDLRDRMAAVRILIFLDSDSASRVRATPSIRRAWDAYRAIHGLGILEAQGEKQSLVIDVPGAAACLSHFPELESAVTGEGEAATFVNAQATEILIKSTRVELTDAWRTLKQESAGSGLDLDRSL